MFFFTFEPLNSIMEKDNVNSSCTCICSCTIWKKLLKKIKCSCCKCIEESENEESIIEDQSELSHNISNISNISAGLNDKNFVAVKCTCNCKCNCTCKCALFCIWSILYKCDCICTYRDCRCTEDILIGKENSFDVEEITPDGARFNLEQILHKQDKTKHFVLNIVKKELSFMNSNTKVGKITTHTFYIPSETKTIDINTKAKKLILELPNKREEIISLIPNVDELHQCKQNTFHSSKNQSVFFKVGLLY